jgi:hypothetical protein
MPKTNKDVIKALEERIKSLEARLSPKGEEQTIVPADIFIKGEVIQPKQEQKYPVPKEYVDIVNNVLNQKFGITIEPQGDRPAFLMVVNVPREYSPLSDSEWEYMKGDIRPKIITYGEGVGGVKTYIELIWNNFNPEVKARIASDRT